MQALGSSPRIELTGGDRRKLVLVIIDGLTPEALEEGLAAGRLPALAALSEAGWTGRATSVFPSLTPVCLTSGTTPTTVNHSKVGLSFTESCCPTASSPGQSRRATESGRLSSSVMARRVDPCPPTVG